MEPHRSRSFLERIGLLTVVDRAALAAYCQAHAELVDATKLLSKEGRVIDEDIIHRFKDEGEWEYKVIGKQLHPAVKLQRDAFTRVKQYLGEFGLTPASRARLQGGGGDEEQPADPFEEPSAVAKRRITDPVTAYASDVVAGKIVAGQLVRQADERHLRDLVEPEARPAGIPPRLKLSSTSSLSSNTQAGKWPARPSNCSRGSTSSSVACSAGRRRMAAVASRSDTSRLRARTASQRSASAAWHFFLLDGEAGFEVYTAATSRDQAKITHEESKRMVIPPAINESEGLQRQPLRRRDQQQI